jgi:hypothetical protein
LLLFTLNEFSRFGRTDQPRDQRIRDAAQ